MAISKLMRILPLALNTTPNHPFLSIFVFVSSMGFKPICDRLPFHENEDDDSNRDHGREVLEAR